MRSLLAILATIALAACTRVTDHADAPIISPATRIVEDERLTVTGPDLSRSPANAFSFAFHDDAPGNTAASGLTLRRAWLLAALVAPPADRAALLPVLGVPSVDALAAEGARRDAPGLALAARAWFAPGTVPDADVRADLERALGAGSDTFQAGPGGAAPINAWIAQRTGVRDLVPDPGARTTRVLVSTLLYRGAWATPFRVTNTRPRPFALADDGEAGPATRRVDVPMMHADAQFPFARSEHASFVALPVGAGDTFLLLAVPTRGTLAELADAMDRGLFERALAGMATEEGIVELPRFRVTSHRPVPTLPPAYRALATVADDVAIHQHVAIDVDEAGASAVAAAAVIEATIAPPGIEPRPRRLRVFRADRPFLYWLVHARTSEILVAGRVVDPR